jgi:hypothetical protein
VNHFRISSGLCDCAPSTSKTGGRIFAQVGHGCSTLSTRWCAAVGDDVPVGIQVKALTAFPEVWSSLEPAAPR